MFARTQPISGHLFKRLAVVVAVGIGAVAISGVLPLVSPPAWAQSDTGKKQQGSSGNAGSKTGQGNQGANAKGQGGPGVDSDGKGPQAGASGGSGGGKPVWAQEGIPEVELGRLSVVRSPDHVLASALEEALATQSDSITSFYNLTLDQAITELSLNWDNVTVYDSPLQSLALLQDVLADGQTSLVGVTNDTVTLEALFLGIASDKTRADHRRHGDRGDHDPRLPDHG